MKNKWALNKAKKRKRERKQEKQIRVPLSFLFEQNPWAKEFETLNGINTDTAKEECKT